MAGRRVLARVMPLGVLMFAAACAPQLTPRQELSWDAFKACQALGPSTTLATIRPDGGGTVNGREGEVFKVTECMNAYIRKAPVEGRTPAQPPALAVTPAPSRPAGFVIPEPPVWSKGDEWRFSSDSASGRRSTYTWRLDREETVDGVLFYVIKNGTREIFYRKPDLAYSHETLKGELDLRNTPPRVYFVWPLAVGAGWTQTYRFERPADQRSHDYSYTASVEAEETITVPAGTFRTLKTVLRNASTKTIFSERWYSPDVRMWVRQRSPALAEGERVRELLSFTPAGGKAETRPK